MRMVYKILIIIMFIVLFVWYKLSTPNSELDKMTKEEIEIYFNKHKKDLKYLVRICNQNPEIEFVDDMDISVLKKHYEVNLSKVTVNKIKEVQQLIEKLKIDSMQCARNNMIINNNLMSTSFMLYSSGLGVSGEGQSIKYRTKIYRDSLKNKEYINIPWQIEYTLPEEGWTVVYMN